MTARRILIDDHLLLRVMLGQEPSSLRPDGGHLSTTGLWYHRLGRALGDSTTTGVMSRQLGEVSSAMATDVVGAIVSLPESIGLVSLRHLAWPMAALLASGAHLNLLSLEALAAAQHLDAEVCLSTDDENPTLLAAAAERGVAVRLVD